MQIRKAHFFILCILGIMSVSAQDLNSSPYTRYGLGEIVTPMSTPYIGMGGASIAMSNFRHINFSNPATYATVRRYTPVFDAGFMGKTSNIRTEKAALNKTTISLRDFALLLPITRKTGFVFGLMPYSNVGYSMQNVNPNEGDSIFYNYAGTGSINRLFLGLGQQIINKGDSIRFSLGVNASYLFGTIERSQSVVFQDESFYNTKLKSKTIARGFQFDAGMHFYEKLNKNLTIQLGATMKLGRQVNAFRDFYAYNYQFGSFNNAEISKDTIENETDIKGYLNLPKGMGFGAAVTFKNKLTASAQYEFQNWNSYYEWFDSVEVHPKQLQQSKKFSFGLEYVPYTGMNIKNIGVLKLSTYRVGFNMGSTPYNIDSLSIKQYGINFGVSIPLISSSSASSISFGFEYGKMGTVQTGQIEDNYFKFNLGFSLSPNARFDRWFRKRLYD